MKCSKCNRDAKGHTKPLGDECKMPPMSDVEIEAMRIVDEQEKTDQNTGDKDQLKDTAIEPSTVGAEAGEVTHGTNDSPVWKELSSQMSALNLTMQVLVQSQTEIQKDVLANTRRLSLLPSSQRQPAPVLSHLATSTTPVYSPPPPHALDLPPPTASSLSYSSLPQSTLNTTQVGAPGRQIPASSTVLPHMMHANPSAETKAKALRGEYVQLEEFAPDELLPPNPALEPFADSRGTLTLRPKRPRKVLNSFDKWLAAWSNYELLLVQNGYDYSQLAHHRATIQYADRKYYWSVIYAYDVKYRLARGEQYSLNFSTAVGDLYGSCFDAAALKPDALRCKRCKSTNHMVVECPFPMGEATYQDRWYHGNQEGCNNWNASKCTYPQCKRAHVCKGCRGPQPILYCNTCRHTPQAQPGSLQGGAVGAR